VKNFGPVPNKDWEYLFLYDKIHPKYRILFFVFRYIYGYKENREKGYFTVRKLQDLAAFLKMHRKMLWKYLKQLEEEGLIWRRGKRIGIGSWSEMYRFVPERPIIEEPLGPVVIRERVAEFPRREEFVPDMVANRWQNVPNQVTNDPKRENYVPISRTNPDPGKKDAPPTEDLLQNADEINEEEDEDFSTWTEKELFGKFYPYRRFFPDGIDHPEKVEEFFIKVILPEINKHYPGYTFNPSSSNLKTLFREYDKILKSKILSGHQSKITL